MTLLDISEYPTLRIITTVTASLSLVGSLFIVISYLIVKKYKRIIRIRENKAHVPKHIKNKPFATRLVVYLSTTDLFASIFYLLSDAVPISDLTQGTFCNFQGWGVQMFALSTDFWTLCIAFNFYVAFIRGNRNAVNRFEKYYHIFGWGVPFVISLSLLGAGVYDNAILWCWIGSKYVAVRFIFFYIPVMLTMIINFVIYVLVLREVRSVMASVKAIGSDQQNVEKYKKAKKLALKFILYTMAFFISWIFAIINRIQNAVDPSYKVYELFVLQGFFIPLQGIINAVSYGLTEYKLRAGYSIFFNYLRSKCVGGSNNNTIENIEEI